MVGITTECLCCEDLQVVLLIAIVSTSDVHNYDTHHNIIVVIVSHQLHSGRDMVNITTEILSIFRMERRTRVVEL